MGVRFSRNLGHGRSQSPRLARESSPIQKQAPEGEHVRLARALEKALLVHRCCPRGINPDEVLIGPSVIQIPFFMRGGSQIQDLQSREVDLAREMGLEGGVRITNLPGCPGYAAAEIPRQERRVPHIRELGPPEEESYPSIALGQTLAGEPYRVELDQLPHLLVAGRSGSGKSFLLRSIVHQLTSLYRVKDLAVVIIDGKGLADFEGFRGEAHLLDDDAYCSDPNSALEYLEQNLLEDHLPEKRELFKRESRKAAEGTGRGISSLRDLRRYAGAEVKSRPLVVVLDEFAEIAASTDAARRLNEAVARFASAGRAVGAHLILATQRPSADIITGAIKQNCARLALSVSSRVDSRVILDERGAEDLLGNGDMLFKAAYGPALRLQGYDVS